MLPRAQRLTTAEEFRATTRRGRRAGGGLLVVHCVQRADGSEPKVGFVVAKSVGNAVTRNRTKRRLRACAREFVNRLPRGTRLVVRALPAAGAASFSTLDAELERALSRVLAA